VNIKFRNMQFLVRLFENLVPGLQTPNVGVQFLGVSHLQNIKKHNIWMYKLLELLAFGQNENVHFEWRIYIFCCISSSESRWQCGKVAD
jgi:hypothetical protein